MLFKKDIAEADKILQEVFENSSPTAKRGIVIIALLFGVTAAIVMACIFTAIEILTS